MANSVNRYFEGLLVGGTLGFVFGLLTAPKPGSELRRELTESADDMLKQANGNWHEIKDKVNERVQPLSDKAGVYKEKVVSQATLVKARAMEKTHDLRDRMETKVGEFKTMAEPKVEMLKEKVGDLKEKAGDLKEKAGEKIGQIQEKINGPDGAELLNNYMGNNSGPMYTAGHKADPDTSAMPVSDSCSNYSAGKAGEGAAGG
jgi:gas vesicle protein